MYCAVKLTTSLFQFNQISHYASFAQSVRIASKIWFSFRISHRNSHVFSQVLLQSTLTQCKDDLNVYLSSRMAIFGQACKSSFSNMYFLRVNVKFVVDNLMYSMSNTSPSGDKSDTYHLSALNVSVAFHRQRVLSNILVPFVSFDMNSYYTYPNETNRTYNLVPHG